MNFKEQLNQLANSYALYENTAEKKKILNEMAAKLYDNQNNIYCRYFNNDFINEQRFCIVYDVLLKTIKTYRTDKNTTFYTYFSKALKNECCTIVNKRNKEKLSCQKCMKILKINQKKRKYMKKQMYQR